MPTIPERQYLPKTNASVDVLNAIRNSATVDYQNYVPIATNDDESIRQIGAIIMDYPSLQNEFVAALINRIGMVLVRTAMYENPWAIFKKGMLDYGETIEEIFVNLAQPFQYDPAVAETNIYKRQNPDIKSAFHMLNYEKYYKNTIQEHDLRKAFLSWGGVSDLISRVIESMATSANYDEYQVMKYLLARTILNGRMKPVQIDTVNAANMKAIAATLRGTSNNLTFLSKEYNPAGVYNKSLRDDQYIILDSNFDAQMSVEVLASAFNMSEAEFLGHRILVDGFGSLDVTRLGQLFANDPAYEEIGQDDLDALAAIPAVVVDRDWFMVFDYLYHMNEKYNEEGLYWNYWLHTWKIFSISPFANAVVFVPGEPGVQVGGITVAPSEATGSVGQKVTFTANVLTDYFATRAVTWTTNSANVTISDSGVATIGEGATGTVTITAASVDEPTVVGTATLTIA